MSIIIRILAAMGFVALVFFIGRFIFRSGKKSLPEKKEKLSDKELMIAERRRIITLAQKQGGRFSLAELYMYSELDEKKLKELLDTMIKDDVCRLDSDDAGVIYYTFNIRSSQKLSK